MMVRYFPGVARDMPSLDFAHGSGLTFRAHPPPAEIGRLVTQAIDIGLAAAAAQERSRTYIGASEIGGPCLRQLFYRATQAPGTPPEGRMRRIWARGHAAETRIITWLRQAGFDLIDRIDDRQLRFSQLDGRFSGGVDGIVTGGPVDLPYPVLLEIKCLKSSSWQSIVKAGLQAFSTTYWWQIHLYMAYFRLKHGLYIVENADTMELWVDLIKLDLASAQAASDRAVQLVVMIENNETPPRIAVSKDHWICRYCDFAKHCWR